MLYITIEEKQESIMNWPEATAAIAAGGGLLAILYKIIDTKKSSGQGKEDPGKIKTIEISISNLTMDLKSLKTLSSQNEKEILKLTANIENVSDDYSQFKIEIQQAVAAVQETLKEDFKDFKKEFKTDIKEELSGFKNEIGKLAQKIDDFIKTLLELNKKA